MIEQLLSDMFPPSLRSLGKVWPDDPQLFEEQGSCGKAKRKRYRDGIERTFAEQEQALSGILKNRFQF